MAALASALVACESSPYRRMRSETEIPVRGLRAEAARRLPVEFERVPVSAGGVAYRMAVEERRGAATGRLFVCVHGVISDRRAWRYVVADLARDGDVLLVDLPGCGESDAPDPRSLGDAVYEPTAMADAVLQAVRHRLGRGPPRRVVLVGHSLGAAIALRALGDPSLVAAHRATVDRVDAGVLLAPLHFALAEPNPLFRRLGTTPDIVFDLASAFGILRRVVAEGVIEAAREPALATREEVERTESALCVSWKRRAAQAMIRRALPMAPDGTPDRAAVARLTADYARVVVPTLVVHGSADVILPPATSRRLREELSRGCLCEVPEAGHPLAIEDPEAVAALVGEFSRTLGAGWPPVRTVKRPAPSSGR